jgi:hypothetical protein
MVTHIVWGFSAPRCFIRLFVFDVGDLAIAWAVYDLIKDGILLVVHGQKSFCVARLKEV